MASLPPSTRDAFSADLLLASETCRTSVGSKRARGQDNTWDIWLGFCAEHEVDAFLEDVEDAIPYLQVFAQRYRDGRLAKGGQPVTARTVEDAIRAIGQTMASMGAEDKRLAGPRQHEYRLSALFAGWKRLDAPPKRCKPVPIGVVQDIALHATGARGVAIANMCIIGFYFLCRPGEHLDTRNEDALTDPFRLHDVEFCLGGKMLQAENAPLESVAASRSVTMVYSNQKNTVRNEGISHGLSGDPVICPVRAVQRQVQHLRTFQAQPDCPIGCWFDSHGKLHRVTSTMLTAAIRQSATRLFQVLGIDPMSLSARGLRAGGATALLCGGVDPVIGKLIGRWKSDEMLKYLHVRAIPLMQNYSSLMLSAGHFTFLADQELPKELLAKYSTDLQEQLLSFVSGSETVPPATPFFNI